MASQANAIFASIVVDFGRLWAAMSDETALPVIVRGQKDLSFQRPFCGRFVL